MSTINGNISLSMRDNYAEYGVSEYYTKVGKSYRNPHFPGVKACLFDWLSRWWKNEKRALSNFDPITVFDMACGKHIGSGEATVCVLQWYQASIGSHKHIQDRKSEVSDRRPPIHAHKRTQNNSLQLDERFPRPTILAADPYTTEAFRERTGMTCSPLSFKDIAEGTLPTISKPASSNVASENEDSASDADAPKIEMVICSFALHLIESPSELFSLLWELSTKAKWLVVLAPHKKPEIKSGWGWTKWDVDSWDACQMNTSAGEILKERYVSHGVNVWKEFTET